MWKKISHKVTSSKFFILYFKKYILSLLYVTFLYVIYIIYTLNNVRDNWLKKKKERNIPLPMQPCIVKLKIFQKNERATKRAQMWSNTVKLDKRFSLAKNRDGKAGNSYRRERTRRSWPTGTGHESLKTRPEREVVWNLPRPPGTARCIIRIEWVE